MVGLLRLLAGVDTGTISLEKLETTASCAGALVTAFCRREATGMPRHREPETLNASLNPSA